MKVEIKCYCVCFCSIFASLLPAANAALINKTLHAAAPGLPRLVIYSQTFHNSTGSPVSLIPLLTESNPVLTHLIVGALHVRPVDELRLNDHLPNDTRFGQLWQDIEVFKKAGVKVMVFVGGAKDKSFNKQGLGGDEATFECSYGQLKGFLEARALQGLDLDVELPTKNSVIERLILRLVADFGADFLITMSPVAQSMRGGRWNKVDYLKLEAQVGEHIAWYNTQFYNQHGTMAGPRDFDAIIATGFKPERIVAGVLTNRKDDFWESFDQLKATVIELRQRYGEIGGIMGWEYFNSGPGGEAKPWEWAGLMTRMLRLGEAGKKGHESNKPASSQP